MNTMKTKPLLNRITLVAIGAATLLRPLSAGAEVNVQTFTQAAGGTYQSAEPAFAEDGPFGARSGAHPWTLGANYHFADNPLVEYDRLDLNRKAVLIEGIHTLQLSGNYYLKKGLALFAAVQLHGVRPAGESYQASLGDARVGANVALTAFEDGKIAVSLVPELYFPTGSTRLMVSNGGLGAGVRVAAERSFGFLRGVVNFGFRAFSDGVFRNIDYRRQAPLAIATLIPVSDRVAINAEYFQAFALTGSENQNPGEIYLGSKLRLPRQMVGNVGIGIGQPDFRRANGVRVHLGVTMDLDLASPVADE